MLTIIYIIFLVLIISGLISGILMFWSLNIPKDREEIKSAPYLTIIIPVRDEETRLPNLLESLKKQAYQNYEVLVVDDASVDTTVSVAESYGTRVIKNKPVGDMMPGKSMACATGAEQAEGEWLLFLDADVQFIDTDSLGNLLSLYKKTGAEGILSVQPYHYIKNPYENLSVIFNIIVMTGMNVFTFWKDKFKTAGSFGPVILCDKKSYMATGGHQAAEESIMDDFALSELFMANNIPVQNFSGKGMISLRMYPDGVGQLIEGWTKNLATASQSTHGLVMTMISLWISGAFVAGTFPVFTLVTGDAAWISVGVLLYSSYAGHTFILARRTGNFSIGACMLFPLLILFFTAIYVYSLYCTYVLKVVTWKGRKIKV